MMRRLTVSIALALAALVPGTSPAQIYGPDGAFEGEAKVGIAKSPNSAFPALRSAGDLDPSQWSEWVRVPKGTALKLDPLLRSNLAALANGDTRAKGLGDTEGRLAIRVRSESVGVAEIESRVRQTGARIEGRWGETVFVSASAQQVERLAADSAISFIEQGSDFEPTRTHLSDGLPLMEAELLSRQGLTGKGVRVGVIDFGFVGKEALIGRGELPQPVAERTFGTPTRQREAAIHGTACAEIIHDVAPDAEQVWAVFDGRDSTLIQAVEWVVSQNVDIISASFGGSVKALNGQDVIDRMVDDVTRRHGILWSIAAGNEAQKGWSGLSVDRNGNSVVDIPGSRAGLDLIAVAGGGGPWMLAIHWDDWGKDPSLPSSTQDIDAYLVVPGPDGRVQPIAASTNPQNGRQSPIEVLQGSDWPRGGVAFLALHRKRVTRDLRLYVTPRGSLQISPIESTASVSSPATARMGMAVGAFDVQSESIADYSSRGPTADGRVKPDVVAPAGTRSLVYGEMGDVFHGTSAAAPHAAGFAALLKQADDTLDGEQLKAATIDAVESISNPVPNNNYGFGMPKGSRVSVRTPSPDPERPAPPPRREESPDSVHDVIDDLLRQQKDEKDGG